MLVKFIFQHQRAIISFAAVGILSAIINLASFSFFWTFLHIHYKLAVSFAYILSVLFHFFANKYFTFKQRHSRVLAQISRYLTVTALNYLITLCVVYLAVETFHLSPYLAIIAAIGVTVNTGFILSHFWIFRTPLKGI